MSHRLLYEHDRLMKAGVGAFDASRRIDNIVKETAGGVTQDEAIIKRALCAAQGGNDAVGALVQ